VSCGVSGQAQTQRILFPTNWLFAWTLGVSAIWELISSIGDSRITPDAQRKSNMTPNAAGKSDTKDKPQ
jgi:hypothetical protein